jgi:predicted MFS family arabinose efflux permease
LTPGNVARFSTTNLTIGKQRFTILKRTAFIIVVCGAIILTLGFGVRQTFGLFIYPMSFDFGWSRSVFALALGIQNLLWGITQPFFGVLVDRFGIVLTLILGTALYVAGLIVMAFGSTPLELHLSAGFLVGLGTSGTAFNLVLAAVAQATPPQQRSLALGIASAGGSLGQFLMPPIAQGLIGAYGWHIALLILGGFIAAMIPLALGMAASDRIRQQLPSTIGLTEALWEATKHRGYMLLNAGFFVCGFHVSFIASHLPAYLISLGFSPMIGAWALAMVGLFNVFGSILISILAGRTRKKFVLSGIYVLRSVSIAAFLVTPASETSVLIFSAMIGLLWFGTVPVTGDLVRQIFGPKYLATLFSVVTLSHQIGAFLGAWIGGYVFDLTQSYGAVWWGAAILGLIAAALHAPIPDKPVRPESPIAAPSR